MELAWRRGEERVGYNRPHTWISLGTRGSGKSSLLESIGVEYLAKGHRIFDLFASRDNENLAWIRSPQFKERPEERILLVKGTNVKTSCPYTVKSVEEIGLHDFDHYDLIISACSMYGSIDEQFFESATLTNKIYTRHSWDRLTYMIVREAANLYYSRLKVSEDQLQAKANMTYLVREARHVGLALGLDTIRFYALDIDIRNLSDYMFIKQLGIYGLPKDLNFLYSFVDPNLFRQLRPDQFIILTRRGGIGYGVFPEVPWHKQEGEDILKEVGIDVSYGEPLQQGKNKGTFTTIGDLEHAEIIRLYMEEGIGQWKIAERMRRSSRSIDLLRDRHNDMVQKFGVCRVCKRAEGAYAEVLAEHACMHS
jgi:hypothetical protein